jgi:uncharacterized protein (DUF433 family)
MERGWRIGSRSLEYALKKLEWSDEKIMDELLSVEIETWRRMEKAEIEMRSRTVDIGALISLHPALIDGKQACVDGTNISVSSIARLHKQGSTPEEISKQYRQLTLATTYAALAYYYTNRAEIEEDITQEKEKLSQLAQDLKQPRLVREWANTQLKKYDNA